MWLTAVPAESTVWVAALSDLARKPLKPTSFAFAFFSVGQGTGTPEREKKTSRASLLGTRGYSSELERRKGTRLARWI